MRMPFTQDYATSTAVVAAAALATMFMSVAEVPTGTRLVTVIGASIVTTLAGNLGAAWRKEPGWWETSEDDEAS